METRLTIQGLRAFADNYIWVLRHKGNAVVVDPGDAAPVLEHLRSSGANPALDVEGIVMTMFDSRTNLAHQVVEEVHKHFADKVFKTVIPRTVRLSEAPSFGKPIIHYDRHSAGATAYTALAKEFLKRQRAEQASAVAVAEPAPPTAVESAAPAAPAPPSSPTA